MESELLKRMDRIEQLLVELNSKIDNFLGFEEIEKDELKELNKTRREINEGKFKTLTNVFGD